VASLLNSKVLKLAVEVQPSRATTQACPYSTRLAFATNTEMESWRKHARSRISSSCCGGVGGSLLQAIGKPSESRFVQEFGHSESAVPVADVGPA
jgi:hypothetical protein